MCKLLERRHMFLRKKEKIEGNLFEIELVRRCLCGLIVCEKARFMSSETFARKLADCCSFTAIF